MLVLFANSETKFAKTKHCGPVNKILTSIKKNKVVKRMNKFKKELQMKKKQR